MPIRTAGRLTKTLVDRAEAGSRTWDSEVPGFGLRVTDAGTKSFIFQFRSRTNEQGRMVIGRYPSMTVEQARKVAREHRVAVDQGGNPSRDRQGARTAATLRDLATHYCDVYGPDRGLKSQTIKDASSGGRLMLNMLAAVAEFEGDLRRERQAEGIQRAKAEGRYRGRPATIDATKIAALQAEGLGATEIAKQLNIGRATVYRLTPAKTG